MRFPAFATPMHAAFALACFLRLTQSPWWSHLQAKMLRHVNFKVSSCRSSSASASRRAVKTFLCATRPKLSARLLSAEAAPAASSASAPSDDGKQQIADFLKKHKQAEHADKFKSWDQLVTARRQDLKTLGIPTKARKRILSAVHLWKMEQRYLNGENFWYSLRPVQPPPNAQLDPNLFRNTEPYWPGGRTPFGYRPHNIKHPWLGWIRPRQRLGTIGEFRAMAMAKAGATGDIGKAPMDEARDAFVAAKQRKAATSRSRDLEQLQDDAEPEQQESAPPRPSSKS